MSTRQFSHIKLLFAVLLFMLSAPCLCRPATAYTLKTLYTLGANPDDGQAPEGKLISDSQGNLFGTAYVGGVYGRGAVFELEPNSDKSAWTYRNIYSFCKLANCPDGVSPQSDLIMDVSGNLYGTTWSGGSQQSAGVVFELMPNVDHSKWKRKILHTFCTGNETPCPDGLRLAAGLTYVGAASGAPYDGLSPLYGVAVAGGPFDQGVVFSLVPHGHKWREATVYAFCSEQDCADGGAPFGDLIADAAGNLFGTTSGMGAGRYGHGGTVFELRPNSNKAKWQESTLYHFCSESDCSDGSTPVAR